MTKKNNYVFLILGLAVFASLTLFLISSKDIKNVEEVQHPVVLSTTVSVTIPDFVEFCGDQISLKRMDMRERFDREVNSFTYFHSNTLLYFKRANRYFPMIEPILKENGIPSDFKYLCVIESNLDTRALSTAKAAGLWQFMEATGKSYGLEITSDVDERYHIEKSTLAACKYFKDAYNRYGNWVDVAASYNAGMGRISSSMRDQLVDSAFDLLLVSETSRYVFRIMALKEIFENPKKYGFVLKKENLYPLVPVQLINISSDVPDLARFAKENGINYMQLKDYNVWLRNTSLKVAPRKSYQIAVPKKEDLIYDTHKVKVHDTNWIK